MNDLLIKIYNLLLKRGFYFFGKNAKVSPFLHTTNKKFISIGESVQIGSFCWIGVDLEYAKVKCNSPNDVRISIGDNTTIGSNAVITANNNISIGKNCMFSAYVFISDHIHGYEDINENLRDQPLSEGGFVIIKDNVFIGIKSSIMRNVTLGEHCVIGADTVVVKDVPSYSVVVGNPGRVIKKYDFKKKMWVKVK